MSKAKPAAPPKGEKRTIGEGWETFTPEERQMMLRAVKKDGEFPDITMGTLPFLEADYVRSCLLAHSGPDDNDGSYRLPRKAKTLAQRIGNLFQRGSFDLLLDQRKVFKRYGGNAVLRFNLPGRPMRVTAGLKWSLPKKRYVPDEDVMVTPVVELTYKSPNCFTVRVTNNYRDRAVEYLMANFAI